MEIVTEVLLRNHPLLVDLGGFDLPLDTELSDPFRAVTGKLSDLGDGGKVRVVSGEELVQRTLLNHPGFTDLGSAEFVANTKLADALRSITRSLGGFLDCEFVFLHKNAKNKGFVP